MSAPVKKTAAAALQAPAPANACFHCGLPVPPGADYAVSVDGVRAPFCCRGCEAVARAILDAGLGDYYRYRTGTPPRARELVPEFLRDAAVYDHPEVQRSFVRREGEHRREAALILEGIVCAACVWLNEQQLARLPGVVAVQINYATRRARVVWDERRLRLSDILQAVARIGYQAHPYDPQRSQELLERERRLHLRRLAVAAVFGMQVMILAVALYFGALSGMEEPFRNFFHGMSLLLTSPAYLLAIPALFAFWRRRLVIGATLACLLIGVVNLMHFSQGWVQFGYRFSNDFAPFATILVTLGIARAVRRGPWGAVAVLLIAASVLINAWGVHWGVRLGW